MNGDKPVYPGDEPNDDLCERSTSMESLYDSDTLDIEDLGGMESENLTE